MRHGIVLSAPKLADYRRRTGRGLSHEKQLYITGSVLQRIFETSDWLVEHGMLIAQLDRQ